MDPKTVFRLTIVGLVISIIMGIVAIARYISMRS